MLISASRLARSLALPITLVGAWSLSSCQYSQDRAMDFLDQYRIAAGVGSAVGVRGSTAGLVDTGIMMGVRPRSTALGWRYGTPMVLDNSNPKIDADEAQIVMTTSLVGYDYGKGSYFSGRNSVAVLPALFSWVDSTPNDMAWQVPEQGEDFDDRHWLWSAESFGDSRYAQVHAFDAELTIGLFFYLDFGYSPGELVDFLLGLATIDIAQDDGAFRRR